jgi:hypothetical protein
MMLRLARPIGLLLLVSACSSESAPAESAPVAPEAPKPTAAPVAAPVAPGPCATPGARTLELEAGVVLKTPWDLELDYTIDNDKKLGTGYVFLLRSGEARWETRRDNGNWTKQMTWRGYCWRGGEAPDKRASRVKVDIAPVCKDGVLQQLGGCGDTLAGL